MRSKWVLRTLTLLLLGWICTTSCGEHPLLAPAVPPVIRRDNPSPLPTLLSAAGLPSPVPGLSVVGGIIVDVHTQRAPSEAIVYLGKVLLLDTGQPVVRLDRDTAPAAIPGHDGEFTFAGVQPGEYGLVLYTPDYSFLVADPVEGGNVMFTVDPNQIVNLGTIEVIIE